VGVYKVIKAAFIDRDGVLNRNVFYSDTGAYESPRTADDFEILPNVMEALRLLVNADYRLFLVSNQPNVAKAKSTIEDLKKTHEKLEMALVNSQIHFEEFYYCYHHPDSSVPGFGGPCECRKPSPYFLQKAEHDYQIDLNRSWMIGDRLTDIECGVAAGVKTVRITSGSLQEGIENNEHRATFSANNLLEAVKRIVAPIGADGMKAPAFPTSD
jgi:D-glycero-D-manno-heptose 1,7-bisphosphate phosphatase